MTVDEVLDSAVDEMTELQLEVRRLAAENDDLRAGIREIGAALDRGLYVPQPGDVSLTDNERYSVTPSTRTLLERLRDMARKLGGEP